MSQFYLHQVRVWWHDERGEKWHRVTSWSSHNQGGAQTANIDTAVMRTCRSLIKIQMKCAYSVISRPALADVTSHHCTMGLRTSVHSESPHWVWHVCRAGTEHIKWHKMAKCEKEDVLSRFLWPYRSPGMTPLPMFAASVIWPLIGWWNTGLASYWLMTRDDMLAEKY